MVGKKGRQVSRPKNDPPLRRVVIGPHTNSPGSNYWGGFGWTDALQGECTSAAKLTGAGRPKHKDGTGDCFDCNFMGAAESPMRVIYSRTELENYWRYT